MKITRNIALNYLEKSRAAKRTAILVEHEECLTETAHDMDDGEIARMIDAFLETQKPLAAKIFVRRYYYSEAVRDIAAKFGISENKATKQLSKLRKELKRYLTERGIALE